MYLKHRFSIIRLFLPGSKFLSINDFLHSHEFSITLCKNDNLPSATCPWSSSCIGQLISATPRLRQEVSGREGHAQVRVLVDRGLAALHRDVVVRFVPEEEVVRDRHREHGPAPGERARTSYEGNLEADMM